MSFGKRIEMGNQGASPRGAMCNLTCQVACKYTAAASVHCKCKGNDPKLKGSTYTTHFNKLISTHRAPDGM
ncbi:hypothetical protein LEQ06_17935 [Paraclostridium sp. AKS46]|uniref:hypothetical protein n=1 Tax=Paraclostridium bifermentans TaxID=1490 RepID=UPI0018FEF53D|nr:hypothetical protein [Paraclostridium bifermentans]MCU9809860.1 hypothetical protein [Paraclostridium sp. AKS46]MCU9809861.1 hypothetical protein [Paraclostridium sp. AKS46]